MIDSLDSEIINMLQKNGRVAFAKIAKKLKVSPKIVQIHYAKMKKAGLIKATVILLDLTRISILMRYTASIGINALETDLEEVAEYIKRLRIDNVSIHRVWITFGRYNIMVGVGSTHLLDIHNIRNLIMQHPSVKTASININRFYWQNDKKTEFANGPFPTAFLDKIDMELLKVLIKDARVSLKQASKTLGVSIDTVGRRIKRLEQEGVILGSTVVLNSKACGYQGVCAFYIKIKSGSSILNVAEKLIKIPAAIALFHLIGEYDFGINVYFKDYKDIISVVNQIRKIEETEVFDTVLYMSEDWEIPGFSYYEKPENLFDIDKNNSLNNILTMQYVK
jgi:Lrp/AsnC family transcriptional regulator, regulator for asnA, asnC and gidA